MRSIFRFQRLLLLIVLALAAGAVPSLRAQEDVLYPYDNQDQNPNQRQRGGHPYRLGVELGANYSLFSNTISYTPFDNPTSPNHVLSSGGGLGGFINIAASRDLGERFRIYARAGAELVRIVSSGSGIMDLPSANNFFDTTAVDVNRSSSTYFYTGELGLQYDFFERDRGLYGSIGLLDHIWGGETTTTDRLELPSGSGRTFPGGGTVQEISGTDTTSFDNDRLGLHLGLGWQIPLAKNLTLTPELSYHYMFGPPIPDGSTQIDQFRTNTLGDLEYAFSDASLNYLRFGVGLWWRL